jgi:hypothetical protein
MYRLIEIYKDNEYKSYLFKTEQELCDHVLDGEKTILFSTHVPDCFVDKLYYFKTEKQLNIYYDVLKSALKTNKDYNFVCDLFDKLHSHNFIIIDFSRNQKKLESAYV